MLRIEKIRVSYAVLFLIVYGSLQVLLIMHQHLHVSSCSAKNQSSTVISSNAQHCLFCDFLLKKTPELSLTAYDFESSLLIFSNSLRKVHDIASFSFLQIHQDSGRAPPFLGSNILFYLIGASIDIPYS